MSVLDLKIGAKIHNRHDIRVKDIATGEETWFQAENIVLDSIASALAGSSQQAFANAIRYGSGTGTPVVTGTALFNLLGSKSVTEVEKVFSTQGTPSYVTISCVLSPSEHVGDTLSEIGLSHSTSGTIIYTHAMIEDSEGNPISIGPKTDTQEITFFSTVYAEVTGTDIDIPLASTTVPNGLIDICLGRSNPNVLQTVTSNSSGSGHFWGFSSDKSPTVDGITYDNPDLARLGNSGSGFSEKNESEIKLAIPLNRVQTSEGNGKIWSIYFTYNTASGTSHRNCFRTVFPNSLWPGYQFVGKAIATGDGVTTEFSLPWNDINEVKAKTWYVDGIPTAATITENTTTSTKIEFASPPANSAPITGDFWVDYIPKDIDHVLDYRFTIQFARG